MIKVDFLVVTLIPEPITSIFAEIFSFYEENSLQIFIGFLSYFLSKPGKKYCCF